MPLYYFDISDGVREVDASGSEFGSLDLARKQAVRYAGELLRDNADTIWYGHDLRVELFDEDRLPVFAVVTSAVSLFPAP